MTRERVPPVKYRCLVLLQQGSRFQKQRTLATPAFECCFKVAGDIGLQPPLLILQNLSPPEQVQNKTTDGFNRWNISAVFLTVVLLLLLTLPGRSDQCYFCYPGTYWDWYTSCTHTQFCGETQECRRDVCNDGSGHSDGVCYFCVDPDWCEVCDICGCDHCLCWPWP
jgi:hypothetical protein